MHLLLQVDPSMIVSHRLPMSNWKEAFDVLMSGECCKIVIDPQQ
jgi:threonine dehydrogenase-like Zn-dependent dehydrogenase